MRVAAVIALVCALSAGCVRVRPWEREQLAAAHMQFSANPYAEQQAHSMLEIMEGSTYSGAGPGGTGAGCGCH